MIRRLNVLLLIAAITCVSAGIASAEPPKEQPARDKSAPSWQAEDAPSGPTLAQRLGGIIPNVRITNAPLKASFEWWSKVTGIPVVMNWESLQAEGVDPAKTINVNQRNFPAAALLAILMEAAAPPQQDSLIYETTPWTIKIMTKTEANKHNVVRVYDVSEMLFTIPDSGANAPTFSLGNNTSSQNTTTGSGITGGITGVTGSSSSSSSSSSPFTTSTTTTAVDTAKMTQENSDKLVDLVKKTIEPRIWDSAGGQASITMYRGLMVVTAPLYVQKQIGRSSTKLTSSSSPAAPASSSTATETKARQASSSPSRGGAAGIDKSSPRPAVGVAP